MKTPILECIPNYSEARRPDDCRSDHEFNYVSGRCHFIGPAFRFRPQPYRLNFRWSS